MKKRLTILCLVVMVSLTACGTNASDDEVASEPAAQNQEQSNDQGNEQSNEQSNEGKVHEQNFGEPFYYDNKYINSTSKVRITLSDHEIVKERSADDRHKDDTDYIKVFVQVENVGDQNSSEAVMDFTSFKAYDSNGVEITKLISFTSFDTRYVENELKPADLRPGGKNEGFLYIPFEENAIPSELIYFESTTQILLQYANQYVFQL